MTTVYLALGANVGNREENLQAAIHLLHSPALRITRVSPVFETEPVGIREQPWFLNLVVEAETTLTPAGLLRRIQQVEQELGRERTVVNGPRTLDVDILLYGESEITARNLEIPHPRLPGRRFVLEPLVALAPGLRHPVTGKRFADYLAEAPPLLIRKLESALALPPAAVTQRE